MKQAKLIFPFLFLISILFMYCCEEECDDPNDRFCPNYNPCLSYDSANADFMILDSLTGWICGGELFGLNTEIDSLFVPNELIFRAKHKNDTYEWKVGTDDRTWTDKEFSLGFGSNGTGDIPITLIVSKDDPDACLPDTQRRDTLTKMVHLYFWNHSTVDNAPPIIGSYLGANEDTPSDTFTIKVGVSNNNLANLPNGCNLTIGIRLSQENFVFANASSPCSNSCGVGSLQEDNKTIIVDYSMEIDGQRINKKFIGTKI